MKLRLLLLLPLLLLLSCDDDPEGQSSARVVYYLNGEAESSMDFRRYVIDRQVDEPIASESVIWISEVAANGKVLFETKHGSTHQLWGRCETGQVLSVPMPVAADPAFEYIYGGSFHQYTSAFRSTTALAYDGHYAAFLSWLRPIGSTDSTTWDLQACIFDCGAWKMRTIGISDFLRSVFISEGKGFRLDGIVPSDLAISNNGEIIALELIATQKRADGDPFARRRMLLGGTVDTMHVLLDSTSPSTAVYLNLTFDGATGTLYAFKLDGSGTGFDCRGGSRIIAPSQWRPASSAFSLSARSGEFVCIGYSSPTDFIKIVRISDGRVTPVAMTADQVAQIAPDVMTLISHLNNTGISISPDGEWLAFEGFAGAETALYIIRRDGTDLRRIATGTNGVRPVVSDVIPY